MIVINVMYCGDSNIAKGLTMSVISLLKNTSEELNVYVITAKIEFEGKTYHPLSQSVCDRLQRYAKGYNPANTVTRIDASEHFENNPTTANLNTRFTPLCMLRLYADVIDSVPEKILYLDCDVICRKEFKAFYDTDLSEYELMGVLDRYGKWFFRRKIQSLDYINSGVLLLNMKKIRETKLFTRCREMCSRKKMFMPDQSAINKLAKYKLFADRIYNEQNEEDNNTVFRHFTTKIKLFPKLEPITVKPWNIEKMHVILNNYEYDGLYEESEKLLKNTGEKR